ncbi:MAG: hypothetical protein Fues2KO_20770 [Fuerstiella sp.]
MNVGLENSTPRRRLLWLLVPSLLFACTGCSLFVMAGKALLGDPKIAAEFRKTTGVDLTDGDDAVVIICSAPHRLQDRYPALQIDIADRVSRNLETRNVKVVPSGDVAGWFDDHGEWGDYSELAQKFDASFVIHIDVREFEHRVPQSENLMQGQAEGRISVHRYQRSEDGKRNEFEPAVTMAFDRDFRLMFPGGYPVPRETRSEDLFVEGFLDRVAQNIGHYFYDVRMSETIY